MRYNPHLDHRHSTRLPTWDYRDTGAYFVTICAHDRASLFGRFVAGELVLNGYGEIVAGEWRRTAELRAEVELDAFIVMPNHVHGIVWIQREPGVMSETTVGARRASPLRPDDAERCVNRPRGAQCSSLGAIIGSFKSAASKRINELRRTPGALVWQRNYYDRIIRDDRELDRAHEYILDNPRKWAEHKHNPVVFHKRPNPGSQT